ncbi:uncharacterized protein FIBRA_02665 [Fibroporia radiculosa]|uniref:F-box domain-containing protein n=1 Tax=Fibroporia radiculosa TaxID=599839 RepID=J4G295_9APHY|nr:uncharacterized protein FIBRA_02665 [Fibroporia radiculosa]CCM00628.1 predicted protein [Fibroporia radiculosa]
MCDDIIDALKDDRQSLKACSLTSRDWTPRARTHLFHSVVVEGVAAYDGWESFLKSSPGIAAYIRRLTLRGDEPAPPGERERLKEWTPIFTHLNFLEELVVECWALGPTEKLWVDLLPVVRSLRLRCIAIPEVDLTYLFSACTQISQISLWMVSTERNGECTFGNPDLPPMPPLPIHVSERGFGTLTTFKCTYTERIVTWFLSSPFKMCIRDLELTCSSNYPDSDYHMGTFLALSKSTLEHLEFSIHGALPPSWSEHFNLEGMDKLATLYIDQRPTYSLEAEHKFTWMLSIFDHIASCTLPSLKEVHITIESLCFATLISVLPVADTPTNLTDGPSATDIPANLASVPPIVDALANLGQKHPKLTVIFDVSEITGSDTWEEETRKVALEVFPNKNRDQFRVVPTRLDYRLCAFRCYPLDEDLDFGGFEVIPVYDRNIV